MQTSRKKCYKAHIFTRLDTINETIKKYASSKHRHGASATHEFQESRHSSPKPLHHPIYPRKSNQMRTKLAATARAAAKPRKNSKTPTKLVNGDEPAEAHAPIDDDEPPAPRKQRRQSTGPRKRSRAAKARPVFDHFCRSPFLFIYILLIVHLVNANAQHVTTQIAPSNNQHITDFIITGDSLKQKENSSDDPPLTVPLIPENAATLTRYSNVRTCG